MQRLLPFVIATSLVIGCDDESAGRHPPPRDRVPVVPEMVPTPESQGLSSARLRALLEDVVARDLDVHGLTIARHGVVILDARFFPWDGRRAHDVASCTKALTSTAVGIALGEGAIASLEEALTSFFPEHAAPAADGITLEHALTMTTGFDCVAEPIESTLLAMQASPDWIAFALDVPVADPPGSTWRYCGTATHLLSGVVSRATGEPTDAYLARKLFEPIGAAPPAWPRDPQGVAHGWGDARMTPAAMIAVGQLWLAGGAFGGAPIVDPAFMARATRNQVGELGPPGGFGYDIWTTDVGYYADGRGGQNIVVVPDLELVVAVTGGQSPEQHGAFLERLEQEVAAVSEGPLEADDASFAALSEAVRIVGLAPAAMPVPAPPPVADAVSGRAFALAPNVLGWASVTLAFDDGATMDVDMGGGATSLSIGLDDVPVVARSVRFADPVRYHDVDVALTGRWLDDGTFEVAFDTIDTIDAGTLRFAFDDDRLTITLYEKTFLLSDIIIDGDA